MHIPYISTRAPWDPTLGLVGLIFGPPVVYFACSWALSAGCAPAASGLLPGVVSAPADEHTQLLLTATGYIFSLGLALWVLTMSMLLVISLFSANERRAVHVREWTEMFAVAFSIYPLVVALVEATACITKGGGAI